MVRRSISELMSRTLAIFPVMIPVTIWKTCDMAGLLVKEKFLIPQLRLSDIYSKFIEICPGLCVKVDDR